MPEKKSAKQIKRLLEFKKKKIASLNKELSSALKEQNKLEGNLLKALVNEKSNKWFIDILAKNLKKLDAISDFTKPKPDNYYQNKAKREWAKVERNHEEQLLKRRLKRTQ